MTFPSRNSMLAGAAAVVIAVLPCGTVARAAKAEKLKIKLTTSAGQDAGTATFAQKKNGVRISIEAKNLPFGDHAVHIHDNPKCDAPDFKSAGPHFNPEGKQHGIRNPEGRHNGDLPLNLSIGEDHTGAVSFTVDHLSLDPAAADSLFLNGGTSIIIHQRPDDMKTDPTGNSGNRIACGVIVPPAS